MNKKLKLAVAGVVAVAAMTSCRPLTVTSVSYQSIINSKGSLPAETPQGASVKAHYLISPQGNLTVVVENLTDRTMVVDQTKSFFIAPSGNSVSYYDPNIRTTSVADLKSGTSGASVNLGAIAGAFGVGGTLGKIANGINVSGSNTTGQTITNTQYTVDQPRFSIAPHGKTALSKAYPIDGIGTKALASEDQGRSITMLDMAPRVSPATFAVAICYSIDGEQTFRTMMSEFTMNTLIQVPTDRSQERHNVPVNNALNRIFELKPNSLAEPFYLIYFNVRNWSKSENIITQCNLYDYQ